MDLAAVMDEVAAHLKPIDGLRVYAYPPDDVTPPAAVVAYPDTLTYDATYGRGTDRMSVPVVVLVGKVSDRASRDRLAVYADGSGERSFKAALEVEDYTTCDFVRVESAEFDVMRMAGVDYLAATFTLDIAGEGAP